MSDQFATGLYRLLIADNEDEPHDHVTRLLTRDKLAERMIVYHAKTEEETLKIWQERYIDLLLLDLSFRKGDKLASGRAILEALSQKGCSADVVIMTGQSLQTSGSELLRSTIRIAQPKVIAFLLKDELDALPAIISRLIRRATQNSVHLENLDFAANLVASRRKRYPDGRRPRAAVEEIAVELDRLSADVFGHIDGFERSTSVSVRLNELERAGLSSAVTLRPEVRLGFGGSEPNSPAYDCVLKIGPVQDIREEYARYQEFVRYGVQLSQRVELLAFAARDALAGIVYSFAGGVYGRPLVSLDELLRENTVVAAQVLESLFKSVNWYSVAVGEDPIRRYMDSAYSARLEECLARNIRSLAKIPSISAVPGMDGDDSTFQVLGGPNLALPGENFLGEGWSLRSHPWCLVHGDMHGGNVMVELRNEQRVSDDRKGDFERACLIDYRNAGPGPRCIDAAALQSSIRIADAEDILVNEGEKPLLTAVRRFDTELQLHKRSWAGRRVPSATWVGQAACVIRGLQKSFNGKVTPDEYLQTVILYVIRQLGLDLHPVVRVRLNTWLAAKYRIFGELKSEPSSQQH